MHPQVGWDCRSLNFAPAPQLTITSPASCRCWETLKLRTGRCGAISYSSYPWSGDNGDNAASTKRRRSCSLSDLSFFTSVRSLLKPSKYATKFMSTANDYPLLASVNPLPFHSKMPRCLRCQSILIFHSCLKSNRIANDDAFTRYLDKPMILSAISSSKDSEDVGTF